MPIPGPGVPISMTTIATEFGGTVPHSLTEYYRGGGLVNNTPTTASIPTSGTIAMGNFYGTAQSPLRVTIPIVLSTPQTNYDVYANRGPTYSPGASDIIVTVNPGVNIAAPSVPAYAMLVPAAFNPADTVTIINNGLITGSGGPAGAGAPGVGGGPGLATNGSGGGNALLVQRPTIIQNAGTIAGGGGGGGGGGRAGPFTTPRPKKAGGPVTASARGGGGGGGAGIPNGLGALAGGIPGAPTLPAVPGNNGTNTTGGSGGAGQSTITPINQANGGPGGPGGGQGANGTAGAAGSTVPSPQVVTAGGTAGAAGNYIVGNPFVTWPVTGTRLGGVA